MVVPTDPDAARLRARMVDLLGRLAVEQGVRPSALPGVKLMRSDRPVPRSPTLYEPSVIVIAQGHKCGFLGGRRFVYDPAHFLVLSVPLPFECQTRTADDGRPMLGVSVGVDPGVLGELLEKLPARRAVDADADDDDVADAIVSAPVDPRLHEATVRLLECLDTPGEAAVLGPQIVREIIYHVLRGAHGDGLRGLAAAHGRLAGVRRALDRIHARYAGPFDVAGLAKTAAMSPSAFHAHFRAVTNASPLQYLKSVRLHKARLLMAYDGLTANESAGRVGYDSASQFGREFKRFFGLPPLAETARLRRTLGLDGPAIPLGPQASPHSIDRPPAAAYPPGIARG